MNSAYLPIDCFCSSLTIRSQVHLSVEVVNVSVWMEQLNWKLSLRREPMTHGKVPAYVVEHRADVVHYAVATVLSCS